MQDFLTVAAATVKLGAIALLFTTFAHYAWTRTAPTPVAVIPTPAAVEPIAVAPALPVEPIALDAPSIPVKRQPKVSTAKEVKAQPKTKRRSIRKVA